MVYRFSLLYYYVILVCHYGSIVIRQKPEPQSRLHPTQGTRWGHPCPVDIFSNQISSPPKLNIFCCKAAGIIDGHHIHNKVKNLNLPKLVCCFEFKGRFLKFGMYHNFLSLFSKLLEITFYTEISKFQ